MHDIREVTCTVKKSIDQLILELVIRRINLTWFKNPILFMLLNVILFSFLPGSMP